MYYVSEIINIPLQIVTIGELQDDTCNALRVLTKDARESDVRRFIAESVGINIQADRQNVDAILQVSVSANNDLFERIRRETTMCEALRELMKDEIEADVEKAVEKAQRETKSMCLTPLRYM